MQKSLNVLVGLVVGAIIGSVLFYMIITIGDSSVILSGLNTVLTYVPGCDISGSCGFFECFDCYYLGLFLGALIGGWIGFKAGGEKVQKQASNEVHEVGGEQTPGTQSNLQQ